MFEVISGTVQTAQKVVLYGPEGIGKSSLAAQFPNPVFIDTEGSTKQLNVQRLQKPSSWEMLKQQVQWVKQQGPARFGTLIIDTVDWAEMLCVESVCATHNKNGVEDFGFGKGYIYVAEEIGRFLNLLSDVVEAGIHVVLTAHAQITKFEQPDEMGAYDRYQLKLGQKTGSRTAPLVKEWADIVLFINYKTYSIATDDKGKKHKAQGGTRTMYTTHHPAWDAKNRHGLPDELPLDYGRIAHIFSQPTSAVASQQTPAIQTQPTHAAASQPTQQQPAATSIPEQAPVVQTQQPDKPTNPTQQPELNPNIPRSLYDLMVQHGVQEYEIQAVVSQKGYYPQDTPITNYDPGFIEGVLVAAWQQVYGMVQETRNQIPFS
ncbi:AAA family ATPase [Paenibacillus sp. BR1-192]|uniref:AAA family ATPase n=1 Tax=Paenibacillus sp. BR1-192 TaxID=3032287 RepID=UPI00240D5D2E|nr:AAA family ATPase [Paenibacillus sp. BR1-192]WFB60544.1 AAA family ATPase [Paenibacillus sp. BR1-192]